MDNLSAIDAENRALRARCTMLRAVIDAIPDAVFVKDLCGGYTMINAAGARLFGRSVDEVVGAEDALLFAPECARQIAEIDRQVIAGRAALTYEETVIIPSDSRSYLTTKAPYFDEQGRVTGVIGIARDVTAEKKLQADRDRLLDRLRLHIDRLPLAYLVFDADRRVLEWNPAAERIFGYSKDEVLGRDGFELIAPLPLNDALQETFQRLWAGDMDAHSVNENRTKSGKTIVCEWTNTPLTDAEGRFAGLIALAQDITERKRAEEVLAQDAMVLANVRDSVQVTDMEGVVTYWNDGSTRLFGWCAEEMLGRHMTDRVPEEGRAAMRAVIRAIADGGEFSGEWEDYRKDGTRVWIDARVTRFTNAGGAPSGLIGLAHDISDRKRAEEALRQSEERFRHYFELGLVGMAITSPTKRILEVNDELCRTLGYAREELLRRSWAELTHADDLVADADLFSDVLSGARDGYTLDKRFVRKDGQVIDTIISVKCQRDRDGSVEYFVALLQDVTERKRAEAEIRKLNADLERRVAERTIELSNMAATLQEQSDNLARTNAELTRAARLKDEFLANMSHELRTPLTGILGLSEGLAEGVYGPLNERQLQSLLDIQESGHHLLSLINDILDVAKIEAGMVKLEPGLVDLQAICRGAISLIKDSVHKKSIAVHLHVDNSVRSLIADERRLKQVLVNLLSNAVKFTDPGGEVGLDVKGDPTGRKVYFTVWDTGIGISAEELKSLFKPFVQIDAGLSRHHGGTGLGLVLVKSLIELHGGSLHTDSEVGRGTRFTAFLPWDPPDAERSSAAPARSDDAPGAGPVAFPTQRPRILIVDDERLGPGAVKDFLEFKGYAVEIAFDAASGIARAQSLSPVLILMDIQMPAMDGLEAIRRIRDLTGLKTVPILAMTALAMPGDRERVLAAGATDYVSKPVSLVDLLRRIQEILERRNRSHPGSQ